jgi:hypothetical protein
MDTSRLRSGTTRSSVGSARDELLLECDVDLTSSLAVNCTRSSAISVVNCSSVSICISYCATRAINSGYAGALCVDIDLFKSSSVMLTTREAITLITDKERCYNTDFNFSIEHNRSDTLLISFVPAKFFSLTLKKADSIITDK